MVVAENHLSGGDLNMELLCGTRDGELLFLDQLDEKHSLLS